MAKDLPKTSLLKYFFRWSFKCSNRSTDGECKKRLLFYTKPKDSITSNELVDVCADGCCLPT